MNQQITVNNDGSITVVINRETFNLPQFPKTNPDRLPVGDYRLEEKLHVWELVQDAIDKDGKVSYGYFSYQLIPEADREHDFCLYCGADNGPHGELRQGFDCYWCGGN